MEIKVNAGRHGRPLLPIDVSTPAGRLGAAIREWRLKRGLTQVTAAAAAGCSQGRWATIEGGRSGCSVYRLGTIAMALGVTVGTLTRGAEL